MSDRETRDLLPNGRLSVSPATRTIFFEVRKLFVNVNSSWIFNRFLEAKTQ